MTDSLLVTDEGTVRTLTFNRPSRANAFNASLYLATAAALRSAAAEENVHVVVLTGAGRSFCAGTDLHEMAEMVKASGPEPPFNVFADALREFPKPLLAAVNGPGIGLGFTMLAHCDLVLISPEARLLAPFTTMGVAPELASSYLFPRRMGRQPAAEILYTAEWVSAERAVETGLALRVVPPHQLLDETLRLARAVAAKPPASVQATKRLMTEAERAGIEQAQAAESAAFAELLRRPKAADAILGQLGPQSNR
jgi:enoyl-CoA hydratase/carnithine racemase